MLGSVAIDKQVKPQSTWVQELVGPFPEGPPGRRIASLFSSFASFWLRIQRGWGGCGRGPHFLVWDLFASFPPVCPSSGLSAHASYSVIWVPFSAISSRVKFPTPEHQQVLSDIFFQQGVLFCSAEGGAHCHMQPPYGALHMVLYLLGCDPSYNHIPPRNSSELKFRCQHLPKEMSLVCWLKCN